MAEIDRYVPYDDGAVDGAAVTPQDSTDLNFTSRYIYLGVSGDVKVALESGEDITFKALSAGVLHPIHATRVYATGTTSADISIVALR